MNQNDLDKILADGFKNGSIRVEIKPSSVRDVKTVEYIRIESVIDKGVIGDPMRPYVELFTHHGKRVEIGDITQEYTKAQPELTATEIAEAIADCRNSDMIAGFLSTQTFADKHPEYAMRFMDVIRCRIIDLYSPVQS